MTTSLNRLDEEISEDPKRRDNFLTRATRMLQGGPSDDEAETRSASNMNFASTNDMAASPNRSDTSDILSTAAATLLDGAVPVREFPADLTSEPASLVQSANSSVTDESLRRKRSSSIQGSHQEELRCVLAIVRHGDRTPKQKLKVNMSEPHILQYFHDQ